MTRPLSRRSLLTVSAAAVAAGALAGRSAVARQAAGPGPGGLVRLIANENPYGPGLRARQAVSEALGSAWQYPFNHDRALKELIAAREGLSPEHVMIGEGSAEILRMAALLHGAGGGEVVAARPTFDFLQSYVRQVGGQVREVPLDADMRHDLAGLAAAIGPRTRLLYLCNPNNPTGTLVSGAELRPFLQDVVKKCPVLVDEAYLDLWDDLPKHTAVDRVAAGDAVIVTRTFSKLHGMAGLRVGYGLAPPALIRELESRRMTIPGSLGIAAATASYQDQEFQAFSKARIREGMAIVLAALRDTGRPHVENGRGNFVFFDTGGPLADFSAAMRREGYLTGRPFAPYDTWARVSLGTVEQMQGFAGALRRYYAS
ncbi:MAG: histidinol-phosphate aminotransferase family protein [Gammaproteobacteria bacterium]|nr:histidinol-phosphate aminotransferase family protein [Gammaproteobacteria bacterium]